MTMIERVARAIRDAQGFEDCGADGRDWRIYVTEARAAIEAMREPTDAMREAAYVGEAPGEPNSFATMWKQAIDATLNGEGRTND